MGAVSATRPLPAPAVTAEIAGHAVALHYGDATTQYASLRDAAALVDRNHRQRLTIAGPQAAEALDGLVTNDVGSLEPGHGCFAAALTAKGKVVADLRIFRTAEGFLTDAPARAAQGWLDTLRKYVNPRLARATDVSPTLGDVGIFGPRAHHVLHEVTGIGPAAFTVLLPFAQVSAEIDGVAVTVARVPDLGVAGFELFAPREAVPSLWARLAGAGAMPAGLTAGELARGEAGRPDGGLAIDEGTLAQEANMDELHAVSYTKGCYLGQENVARVHFRGHVNRQLRGLQLAGDRLPPPRAVLVDDTGKPVGDVRSAVLSPRLGAIAIAMVRREVPLGAALQARWDEDGAPATAAATMQALPFAG